MKVKCVVPCRDSFGLPSLFYCEIECSIDEFNGGKHYTHASFVARLEGFEVPDESAVFDQYDDPGLIAYVEAR